MRQGKLPLEMLARLLDRLPAGDPRVIVGPAVGEDAAAIALGDRIAVVGMDPITFATDLIGWYAVQVNANDIAAMGARPRWFLAALLLPEEVGEPAVAAIFDQMVGACERLGVALVGGHTEVTAAVTQPVVVGCMLGEVEGEQVILTGGARPGDEIVLCGTAGVEGTAILAREAPAALAERGMTEQEVALARSVLTAPGISVVGAALGAARAGVSAMHDPTEGGIATGLLELARASGVGVEVDQAAIGVLPITARVCSALGIDPLGLIASGALLATTSPTRTAAVMAELSGLGLQASVIGRVVPCEEGVTMLVHGERRPLPRFARDEVARLLDEQAAGG